MANTPCKLTHYNLRTRNHKTCISQRINLRLSMQIAYSGYEFRPWEVFIQVSKQIHTLTNHFTIVLQSWNLKTPNFILGNKQHNIITNTMKFFKKTMDLDSEIQLETDQRRYDPYFSCRVNLFFVPNGLVR